MKQKVCFVLPLLIGLTGCAVREANLHAIDNQGPLSDKARTEIANEVRNTFFDPYSIRDAEVSSAVPTMTLDEKTVYMVCLRANAKNRLGGYTGKRATIFYFTADWKLFDTNDQDTFGFCSNSRLNWGPFPEIEKIESGKGHTSRSIKPR